MPFKPVRRRCANCKKFFMATKENQRFHSVRCRTDFHNNGKTPEQQMVSRLNRYMKTPAFRKSLRDVIVQELGKGFGKLNREVETEIAKFCQLPEV